MPNVKFKNGYSQDLPSSIENGNLYALSDTNQLIIDINDSRISLDSVEGKQDTLVSGVNIKTINGNPILGMGDLTITSDHTIWNVSTTTSWTYDSINEIYYQTVNVSGLTALDSPWVDLNLMSQTSKTAMSTLISSWSNILKIETYNGYIKLYSTQEISSVLPLIIKR